MALASPFPFPLPSPHGWVPHFFQFLPSPQNVHRNHGYDRRLSLLPFLLCVMTVIKYFCGASLRLVRRTLMMSHLSSPAYWNYELLVNFILPSLTGLTLQQIQTRCTCITNPTRLMSFVSSVIFYFHCFLRWTNNFYCVLRMCKLVDLQSVDCWIWLRAPSRPSEVTGRSLFF